MHAENWGFLNIDNVSGKKIILEDFLKYILHLTLGRLTVFVSFFLQREDASLPSGSCGLWLGPPPCFSVSVLSPDVLVGSEGQIQSNALVETLLCCLWHLFTYKRSFYSTFSLVNLQAIPQVRNPN